MASDPAGAAGAGRAPHFASLYVGDLHSDVTEAMLYEIFNAVGPVASIRVCRDSVKRKSLGYAYVNFRNVEDAEKALDTLNYSSIRGRSCRIMWSQRDPSGRKGIPGNIYVKNLDLSIDNKALFDTFSLFGSIVSCKVASSPEGKSYGYGFVHYETDEAAQQAVERVNGMQIGEKTVLVSRLVKREERTPASVTEYTNLYVKGFPDDWDEDKLREELGKCGPIRASALRTDKRGRRMAFVDFETTEDAQKCVAEMHMKDVRTEDEIAKAREEGEEEAGKDPDGHPTGKLFVQRVVSRQEREREAKAASASVKKEPKVNLYVKNLDESMDDAKLRELFEPFGSVISVSAQKDADGRCKGYGFVCFETPAEATKAVTQMHLTVIKGKPLYVGLAEKREERQERLRLRYNPGASGKGFAGAGGKGAWVPGGVEPPSGAMPFPGMPPMLPGMPPMNMFGKGGPPVSMFGKGGMPMGMMPQPVMGMMPQAMMGMGMMRPRMVPGSMVRPMGAGLVAGGALPGAAPRPPRPHLPPLSPSALAAAPPTVQKQMLGERLYMLISCVQPELAGKITGMMLEMDTSELLLLLDSEQQLKTKVDEALLVLNRSK